MQDDQLIASVTEKAQQWLSSEYDSNTREEVARLLAQEDKTDLIDSFYKPLEFGTGGLRGIMGVGTNRMNIYTVAMATQGLANYLQQVFPNEEISVVIGHDCRNNSPLFTQTAASVFSANGIKTYVFDELKPTPMVSFAIRQLQCKAGIMITASHNPKEYNGYKAFWSDGAQIIAPHDENIIHEVTQIQSIGEVKRERCEALITSVPCEVEEQFIEKVCSLALSPDLIEKHKATKIVYTPIHGTGVKVVPQALRQLGFTEIISVPEQDVVSGDFPTVVSPNPEEPAALSMAIQKAQTTGAELVLASDPDGDRLGVAIRHRQGEMALLNGNQICALLIYYAIVRRSETNALTPKDYVVKTIVTTDLIQEIATTYGVSVYECYTGFKWIAALIREKENTENYIGGGEESYGFLAETFVRDKNSVSACCLFAELFVWAKENGFTLFELLDKIYEQWGFFLEKGFSIVRKGKSGAEEIGRMMQEYRNQPPRDLAGSPIVEILDYQSLERICLLTGKKYPIQMPTTSNVLQYKTENGTSLSIRPSGTEPKIKYYIGVKEKKSASESAEDMRQILENRIQHICQQLGI